MKRLLTMLALLLCAEVSAQRIRLFDFMPVSEEHPEAGAGVRDIHGNPCALIKIYSTVSGLTFEAGLAGIMDTHYERDAVWLYIPADARELSISHPEYGALRGWPIPVSLVGGSTYSVKLSIATPVAVMAHPKPVHVSAMPAKQAGSGRSSGGTFCRHFLDAYGGLCLCGGGLEDVHAGLCYTYMPGRAGAYMSAALNTYGELSGTAGLATRLLPEDRSSFDWQLYGGVGLFEEESLGFEIGTRIAWKAGYSLSRWDIGLGCQFWDGNVMPTVSVGFCIWGIPVAVGAGLCLCALGGL